MDDRASGHSLRSLLVNLSSPQHAARPPLEWAYRNHHAYVWRLLRHFGVAEADLDDALQEVFVVGFRRLPEFEGRSSMQTWLGGIAWRVASSRRRGLRRDRAKRERADVEIRESSSSNPEEAVLEREAEQVLASLIAKLDEPKRRVFVMAVIEELPVVEIARILGLNVRTAHSRLRLARAQMRADLQRHRAIEAGSIERALMKARRRRPPHEASRRTWLAVLTHVQSVQAVSAVAMTSTVVRWRSFVIATLTALLVGAAAAPVAHGWSTKVRTGPMSASHPPHGIVERFATLESSEANHDADPSPGMYPAPHDPALASPRNSSAEPTFVTPPIADSHPSETTSLVLARSDGDITAELELVKQMRRALVQNDPSRVLELALQHERRFPHGILRAERSSSRLRALCRAGRTDEARSLIRRLQAEEPSGRWTSTLGSDCK